MDHCQIHFHLENCQFLLDQCQMETLQDLYQLHLDHFQSDQIQSHLH